MSQQSQTTRKVLNSAWVCAGLEKVSTRLKKQNHTIESIPQKKGYTETSSKDYFWFYCQSSSSHTCLNDCVQFKCYCTDVLYHVWKAGWHTVWVRMCALSIPLRRAACSSPAALCAYGRSADPEMVSWAGEERRPERQPELRKLPVCGVYSTFVLRGGWQVCNSELARGLKLKTVRKQWTVWFLQRMTAALVKLMEPQL